MPKNISFDYCPTLIFMDGKCILITYNYSVNSINAHVTPAVSVYVFLLLNMVTQILTILTTLVASSYHLVDLSHGQLNVYGSVPGLDPSPYYSIQVRAADGRSGWREAFTWLTECTAEKFCNTTGAFNYLANWSNSYINFEMEAGAEVEVKITKLWGDEPITKAVVHPRQAATSCEVTEAGEAVVTINKPGLFTVDINGQMDDQDTGKLPNSRGFYDGPPIHTVTIFANPILEDKPSLEDAGVHQVSPGEQPPTEGDWDTLYFLPGVHDIGHSYPVRGSRRYYIPGDALVYGTINSFASPGDTDNVTIYGHGTLSGDRLPHPHYSDLPEAEHWRYGPVGIQHTPGTRLLGLTVANSAYHSVMLQQGTSDRPILVSWVKMMTWRANGDGFNPQKFAVMEDCFIRTQDDSSYVNGLGIRRVVYWQVQ